MKQGAAVHPSHQICRVAHPPECPGWKCVFALQMLSLSAAPCWTGRLWNLNFKSHSYKVMIWKYGNYIYLVVVLCWLWPFNVFFVGCFCWVWLGFFWLLFLFFLLTNKTQFCFFSKFLILQSCFLWISVTQTGLQKLFLHKLQGDHMCSQTSSWDHEIPLYPPPSSTARFTLKLIREIYFTEFPALKGTAYFAYLVWHCWNCERSWTFPRVPVVEAASSARHRGVGSALLGGMWCQGMQTAVSPRFLPSQDLWLWSRLPSH